MFEYFEVTQSFRFDHNRHNNACDILNLCFDFKLVIHGVVNEEDFSYPAFLTCLWAYLSNTSLSHINVIYCKIGTSI